MRSLENMTRLGLARKLARKNPPRYKLTRAGFIKTVNALVSLPLQDSFSEFFFVYQFIVNYKSRIIGSLDQDVKNFTKTTALDVQFLMNETKYVHRQKELVSQEIRYIKERIIDSENSICLFKKMKADRTDPEKIFKTIQAKHPYELSSQKRLSRLLFEIPEYLREHELTEANQNRIDFFWKPKLQHLEAFEQILQGLVRPRKGQKN
ncbi:MAG: hypothetical protein JNL11_09980 [Bdellovibrionaceae bacterium]|nr:hypothetical protein [Pseudobdellovibrionaceae bacterium]